MNKSSDSIKGVEKAPLKPLTAEQQALVLQWGGLVLRIAREYFPGTIPDDVIAEGTMGLVIAAARFDKSKNVLYQSYAQHWVRAMILQFIMASQGPVKFGGRRQDRHCFFNLGRARREFERSNPGVTATPEHLAPLLGVDVGTVTGMMTRMNKSADVFLDDPEVHHPIKETGPSIEDDLGLIEWEKFRGARIRQALNKLVPVRDAYIIRQRFLVAKPRTLQDIADELGLSRERVRQCELRALQQLRVVLNRDKKFELAIR